MIALAECSKIARHMPSAPRTLMLAFTAVLVVHSRPLDASFPGIPGLIGFTNSPSVYGSVLAVQPNGTGVVELPNTHGVNAFSWSPDGSRVAFARRDDIFHKNEIYVMNVDGSNLTQLTFFDGTDDEPGWSPDGSKIVWQRECDIWVMNADGSDQQNLSQPPGDCTTVATQDRHPKWPRART
jgi:TolB protein